MNNRTKETPNKQHCSKFAKATGIFLAAALSLGTLMFLPSEQFTQTGFGITAEAARDLENELKLTATFSGAEINLRWINLNDAKYYQVIVSQDVLSFTSENLTESKYSIDVTKLIADTPIKVKLMLYNDTKAFGSYSFVIDEPKNLDTTLVEKSKCVFVDNVSAALTDTSITLSWSEVPKAEKYTVLYGRSMSSLANSYVTTMETTCTIENLDTGMAYDFLIYSDLAKTPVKLSYVVINAPVKTEEKTESKPAETESSVLTSSVAPDVKATGGKKKITLAWGKVAGATGYRVYRYDSKKNAYVKYKTVTSTKCVISKLASGKTYKFKVTSLYRKNGKIVESEPTAVSATTKKS